MTSVTAGSGLETSPGAGITGSGSIAISAGGVTSTHLADGSVVTAKLADGAATTAKLADGSVTGAKLETVATVTAGTYGSTSAVPVIQVDSKGRITSVTNTSIDVLPSGTSGQFLKSNGTAWSGSAITLGDLKSSVAGNLFSAPNCSSNQTLSWSVVTDQFSCISIGSLDAAAITAGTLDAARLPTIATNKGGTGLTSIGTANQVLGVNATADGLEYKSITAGTGVTITPSAGGLQIAATGSGGTVTSVSGTAPISVATGTTTPAISISQATTSTDGYLSSTDWNTFNNKLGSVAGSTLTGGNIWVGNASNQATSVTMSGEGAISNTGVFSLSSVGTAGTYGAAATVPVITTDAKGRVTGVTNTAISITKSQVSDFPTLGTASAQDVGTAAGNVVQLDGGAKIPASLLPTSAVTQWTTAGSDIYYSTGNVGIGTATPAASLDISAKTDSIAIPRGTTAQRPASPVNGFVRYNTDTKGVEAYVNGSWQQIASGATPGVGQDGQSLRWNNTTGQFEWFTAGAAGAGLQSLNGATGNTQTFTTATTGTDFSISTNTGTGVHTFALPSASGTARGLLSSADWTTFNSKLGAVAGSSLTSGNIWVGNGSNQAASVAMSGEGAISNTGVFSLSSVGTAGTYGSATSVPVITTDAKGRVTGVTNTAITGLLPSGTSGQFLKSDGTNWASSAISITDLKSSVAGNLFNAPNCAANQTLSWSVVTDQFSCISIGSLDAAVITTGTIDSARLPTSASAWTVSGSDVYRSTGNVGIGTAIPATALDVNGVISAASGTNAAPSITFRGDLNTGVYAPSADYLALATNGVERFSIDDTGIVRLSTSLQVDSSMVNSSVPLQVGGNSTAATPGYGFANGVGIFSPGVNVLAFGTSSAERIRITTTGNVGVGTTAPAAGARLDVVGGAIQAGPTGTAATNGGQVRFAELATNGAEYVGFRAPDAVTTNLVWQLPGADGSANQVLTTNGAGILSWSTPASSGLSSINGATVAAQNLYTGSTGTDFTISTNTGTGIHTFSIPSSSATARGLLTSADWTTFNNKLSTVAESTLSSGNIWIGNGSNQAASVLPSGDVTVANNGAFTVTRIRGNQVAAGTLATGQLYMWDGTNLSPTWFGMDDLRTSIGGAQFAANCTASQTLVWSALTDAFTCSNIAGLDAGVITTGTIDSARLPASASAWTISGSDVYRSSGNVGIGTATPLDPLHIHVTNSKDGLRITDQTSGTGIQFQAFYPSINFNQYWDGANNRKIGTGFSAFINQEPTIGVLRIGISASGAAGSVASSTAVPLQFRGDGRTEFGANVGFGAANPTSRLQVASNFSAASWTTGGAILRVDNSTITDTTGSGTIADRAINSLGTQTLASTNPVTLTNASTLYIAGAPIAGTNTSITNPLALRVASGNSSFGGNVGIGTTSPASALDVYGTVTASGMQIGRGGGPNYLLFNGVNTGLAHTEGTGMNDYISTIHNGVNGWQIHNGFIQGSGAGGARVASGDSVTTPAYAWRNNSNMGMYRAAADTVGFVTQSTERMRITSGGNVGIGTVTPDFGIGYTTPVRVLGIAGDGSASAASTGTLALANNRATPTVGDTAGSVDFVSVGNGAGVAQLGARMKSVLTGAGGANGMGHDLVLYTKADNTAGITEKMRIQADGNVGIGNTVPATLLDVSGAITSRPSGTAAGQTGQFIMRELAASGTNTATIRAPDSLAADYTLTLPADDGTSGQVLQTNGSGVLSWATVPTSGGTFLAASGNATTPGFAFNADANTGFYNEYDGNISLTANGSRIFSFDANGMYSSQTGGPMVNSVNGVASTPSFSFVGDQDTGIFRVAADTIGFSTAGTEQMRINATGNVGIGEANPTNKLHVQGDIYATGNLTSGNGILSVFPWDDTVYTSTSTTTASPPGITASLVQTADNVGAASTISLSTRRGATNASAFISAITPATGQSPALAFVQQTGATAYSERMRIHENGNVGIGTTAPGEKLEVNGNVKATSFISTSDRRLKTNIKEAAGLNAILQLNGYEYDWIQDGTHDMGVIAQEVERIFPSAVRTDAKTGMKAVKYQALIAPLIQSTKELSRICRDTEKRLDREVASLKEENRKLRESNDELKRRLEIIEEKLGIGK